MTQTQSTLALKVEAIEEKASNYETATNFESKKSKYLNELKSIDRSLRNLKNELDRMEFLAAVVVRVIDRDEDIPSKVEDARQHVRSVVNHDPDYYYEQINEGSVDQYEQKIQQAQSNVNSAKESLRNILQDFQRKWEQKINAAQNVQRLFGDSKDMTSMLNKIDAFVKRRMWDNSESISTLQGEWQGLKKRWERTGMDWETFQQKNELSTDTIEILKQLAKGEDIQLDRLNEDIAKELLSVDDLRHVVNLTI